MKKIYLILIFTTVILILSSCVDDKVYKIKNVTWVSDKYDIVVTSEQLYKQAYDVDYTLNDLSKITFRNNQYYCWLGFYGYYDLSIINEQDLSFNHVLNDSHIFFSGTFELIKEKKDDYKYKIVVKLYEEYGYYNYCISNNIEFDDELTFYGYLNN